MNTSPDVAARVVVVGGALVDVVRHEDGRSAEHPGGSPLNVAYGLGRLGHRVQFLGRIGDDARGGRLRAHLAGAGVDLFHGSLGPGPTSVAQAQVDDEGRATYEFDVDSTLPRVQLPADLDHVHTGSIGAGDASTSGLLDALARAGLLGVAARPRLRHLSSPLLRAVVETAVHCASATCRRAGARPPPDREELRRHLDAVGSWGTGLGGRCQAGCCWVMQWMPPPKANTSRASTCTTSRPG